MTKNSETKERQFYAVVEVRKADMVAPSEGQLMSYYTDYGYKNVDEVIEDYGFEEMIREWYNNTNWTEGFSEHREQNNILWADFDKEYESVRSVPQQEWERHQKLNYGY
jgi:hypothetical protein